MTKWLIPPIESRLPDLMPFINHLASQTANGKLDSWQVVAAQVQAFFTPTMMNQMEATIPGWREMASYSNSVTLIHVILVFTALLLNPEYQSARAEQQALMKWIVLFHDLGKVVPDGKRDLSHGFRSAALAGQQLPQLGFAATDNFSSDIEEWVTFTRQAFTGNRETQETIQDNRQLPKIVDGIDRLFGHNSPAALVVKTVLFHMSITVVTAWPQVAPLTEQEIHLYIDDELLALLKVMMIVDGEAWSFFDKPTRNQGHAEMLAVFERLQQLIA